MYQAVLTRKYLTSKVMPLLAMAAVMLSVATVLVTWSVMGGFLNTLLTSGKRMIGDVKISWPNTGFGYYDDLIERLEADPAIEAAAPMIESFGLMTLPDDRVEGVQIRGVDGESFARVTDYANTVWWKPVDGPVPKDTERNDPRLGEGFWSDVDWAQVEQDGLILSETDGSPAAVMGIELGFNQRAAGGIYVPQIGLQFAPDGTERVLAMWLPENAITLHAMPLDNSGRGVDVTTRTVPVANEFNSGIFDIDNGVILIRLDLAQDMLRMTEQRTVTVGGPRLVIDPVTGAESIERPEITGVDPARVTAVLVRGVDGITAERVREVIRRETTNESGEVIGYEGIWADFAADHAGEVPSAQNIRVQTWRDLNRTMIAAVEKETGLVLFIFGLVCFTTVFLVLAIFWSMISEKTRDIGILRSLGASTAGITWLWLRYGAAVGLTGSLVGVGAAILVVRNINEIHDWMGEKLKLSIWDPSVYYFVRIPTDLDLSKAVIVASAGVLTCLLGALIPALRAGLMAPVRALRFE